MLPVQLKGGQLDDKYVKSCRVRTGRNVRGLCLPPAISRVERREVERILTEALAGLSGDFAGTYYPLSKMTTDEEKQLIEVGSIPGCLLLLVANGLFVLLMVHVIKW